MFAVTAVSASAYQHHCIAPVTFFSFKQERQNELDHLLKMIAYDPHFTIQDEEQGNWLKKVLEKQNEEEALFTPQQLDRLKIKLMLKFRERISINYNDGTYYISIDFGSGATGIWKFTQDPFREILASIGIDKKDPLNSKRSFFLYRAFKKWENKYKITHESGNKQNALKRFHREIAAKYPSVQLFTNGHTSSLMIDFVTHLLKLLPPSLLESKVIESRLRGGINLERERHQSTRIAHYEEEYGVLGIQPTTFSKREFIEAFLHEFGHVFEEEHLADPDFRKLLTRALNDRYVYPAVGQPALTRYEYTRELEELFAETFMHYILHGDQFAFGFSDTVINPQLWKVIYTYYRNHIFHGKEYRVYKGKLTLLDAAEDPEADEDTDIFDLSGLIQNHLPEFAL